MSVLDMIIESTKAFVQNTDIKEYINRIYEISVSSSMIEWLIDDLRRKLRYRDRFDDRYFIPDVCGFFVCTKCSESFYLDSGIYIIADKIVRWLEYLNFLDPRILSQYIVLHELAHLIVHCVLPKHVRTEYTRAKSEIKFYKNLEEAYCEYCAICALKYGTLRVLNQSVRIPKEEEFELALISLLPRPEPYLYFKELVRLQEIKSEKEVDNIMHSFIGGMINSQDRISRLLHSDLAINIIKRPIDFENRIKKIDMREFSILDKVKPCMAYSLYIVRTGVV